MAGERTQLQDRPRPVARGPAVVVDGLSVTYRVYEDRRPTLRRSLAGRLKPRPYRAIHAVRDVTTVIGRGEAVGVLGRNGSGKSTFLRAVAGLLPPDGGAVHARTTPLLLGVAAALQQNLSGRQNVLLGGTALGIRRRELLARTDEIMSFAGLEDFADVPLRAYSSGMSARLQFAIATAVSPEVLLVDEALAVGDAEFRARSAGRIAELLEGAGTVFLVSHSLSTIRDICTRALWLDQGRLVLDGPVAEVSAAYEAATTP